MPRTERLNPETKVVVKTKPRIPCRATAFFSHMGGRPTQQDAGQIWENPAIGSTFVVVCDGVGGSRSGAEASAVVIQTAGQLWKDRGGVFADPRKDLLSLSNVARNRITDLAVAGEKRAPASTIVALYLTPTEAHWIHAGDSRLYHFRNSQVVTRTRDHSVVQILVDQGEVTEEEMGSHPDQGRLLQSLGTQEYRDPAYGTASIGQTDAFLLCTDGFWERTPPAAMASLFLAEPPNLEPELRKLVTRAVQANGPSGDNVTAAIVAPLTRPARSPAGDFIKRLSPYLVSFAAILFAVGGIAAYRLMTGEPETVAVNTGSNGATGSSGRTVGQPLTGTPAVAPPTNSPVANPTPSIISPSPAPRARPTPPASPASATPIPSPSPAPAATSGPKASPTPTSSPGPLSKFPAGNIIGTTPTQPANIPNPNPDDTSDGENIPRSASKDHPFVNSLGMKFVPADVVSPLVIKGGRVLFSVWATGVQDYEAYEKSKRLKPSYQHEDKMEYPIVNVAWDEANDFCRWLTEQERSSGKIGRHDAYRLPTDLEWSCAVGLGVKPGNNGKVYPWGTQWPPPKESGNYSQKLQVDDFQTTSPVGSFTANPFGLYDMGGNVWQWCRDEYEARMNNNNPKAFKSYPLLDVERAPDGTPYHVLRGASWMDRDKILLRSDFRENGDRAQDNIGFRCVLEVVGSG